MTYILQKCMVNLSPRIYKSRKSERENSQSRGVSIVKQTCKGGSYLHAIFDKCMLAAIRNFMEGIDSLRPIICQERDMKRVGIDLRPVITSTRVSDVERANSRSTHNLQPH